MLKKVLIGVAVVLVALLAFIATRPNEFQVSRSATLPGSADVVFAQVNDFKNWKAWSPWADRDPNQKTTMEGAPAGVGSTYAWEGNDQVGAGRMTITESQPNSLVKIDLQFLRPFESKNVTEF